MRRTRLLVVGVLAAAVVGAGAVFAVATGDDRSLTPVSLASKVFTAPTADDLCPGRALIPGDAVTAEGVALALIIRVVDLEHFAGVRAAASGRAAQRAVADVYRNRLVMVARAMGADEEQLSAFAADALPVPFNRGDGTFGLVPGHHVIRIPVGMVARACEVGELAEVEWLWADAQLLPTKRS